MNYRPVLNQIPPVVKNLIIINVLFLLATWVVKNMGIDLVEVMGMHYPGSDKFRLHQIITYMFMHGGLTHIFFNMFALYMFGAFWKVSGARNGS
jgi:membrane associated rhomboid family serine protease